MKVIFHIDFNSYFASVEQQANPRLRGKPVGVTGGDRMERTVLGAASIEAKKFGVKTGMQIWEAKKLCPNIIIVPGDSDKYLETTKRFLNIGISYNKLMAKLAGSLQKPDGLVVIPNQKEAVKVLDRIALDEICGIGSRIKLRLNNMGIFDFRQLRKAPLKSLLASFKSYGQVLYDMARGIDHSPIVPFYEKEEVKSIGHRHTPNHDTNDLLEIKRILLKPSTAGIVKVRP